MFLYLPGRWFYQLPHWCFSNRTRGPTGKMFFDVAAVLSESKLVWTGDVSWIEIAPLGEISFGRPMVSPTHRKSLKRLDLNQRVKQWYLWDILATPFPRPLSKDAEKLKTWKYDVSSTIQDYIVTIYYIILYYNVSNMTFFLKVPI